MHVTHGLHKFTHNLRIIYALVMQSLRSRCVEFTHVTQGLRKVMHNLCIIYALVTQHLRSSYALVMQSLRNFYSCDPGFKQFMRAVNYLRMFRRYGNRRS
jgi:hypothetical protein